MSAERGYIVPPKNRDRYKRDWNESHYSRVGEKIAREQRERMRRAEVQQRRREQVADLYVVDDDPTHR